MLSLWSQQAHTYTTATSINTDSTSSLILLPFGTDVSPPAAGITDTQVSDPWNHSCGWHALSLTPVSTVAGTQTQGPSDSPGSPFL